ncbi:MAG: hypothetical protein OXC19_06060 [Bryobacterales bacterium]|nr:hypothetical protein [Bryobacterales bacterium]
MTISLPTDEFDWDQNAVFASDVLRQVRSLPSISDAAVVHGIPMRESSYLSDGQGTIEGHVPANEANEPKYGIRVVSPGYLATLQIPIVAGRAFEARNEQRGAACSFLVSDSFARALLEGAGPAGEADEFRRSTWRLANGGCRGRGKCAVFGTRDVPDRRHLFSAGLVPAISDHPDRSNENRPAQRGAVSAGAYVA